MKLKTLARTTFVILTALLSIMVVCRGFNYFWRAEERKWTLVTAGQSEAKVRTLLGTPWREYSREAAPRDYYVRLFTHKERAITGKVLIYATADRIFYVWLGTDGNVEDTFYGRS